MLWGQYALRVMANFDTRRRVIGHMMRGALACMRLWRWFILPPFPPEIVEESDFADRADRRVARRVGVIPGTGIQFGFEVLGNGVA